MKRGSRFGYGLKLGLSHVLLVVAVGAVVMLLIDRELGADLVGELDARLQAQAMGASEWVAEGRHPDRLATRLGDIVGADVTIFDAHGRVLGDSAAELGLGTDASRVPEIAEAIAGRTGRASRLSRSGVEMRFVAVPATAGVGLRLGGSLARIRATVHQVRTRLAVASGIGVLLAVLLSSLASRLAARPLRTMKDAARRIADGDYGVVLAGESRDEFGELERSLSVLASRLSRDRERIERLEATRRDFVANVSHELRTPITAIQGYAETLLRGTADPETARQFLVTMHRQAMRIGELVSDLLRLSELEARVPQDSPLVAIPLADVAREAVATVREGRATTVRITLDVPEGLFVMGYAAGVEQIIENLIENAVRHGAKEEVRVSAHRETGHVRISVRDDGPGIDVEHLTRVFERFYRVESGRTGAERGTGLGLSIVKHLAEAMGGSVHVESEIGKGAVFTVELDELRAPPALDLD